MPVRRYIRWLHTRWPAGTVEKLPEADEAGRTALAGVRIVGDLTGIPLLKFAADGGARAVQAFLGEEGFRKSRGGDSGVLDVAIVGAGVAGIAAALEARRQGLGFEVFEASRPFSTIANFPRGKPIFTYPTGMKPAGGLRLGAAVKEELLDELERQRREAGIGVTQARVESIERRGGLLHLRHGEGETRALRVVVAIGRSGNFRKLGVPGEELDKVSNRLHDPAAFAGKQVLVVGGGDSAVEAAVALAGAGAGVTLGYRGKELTRPKPENLERVRELAGRAGKLTLALGSRVKRIEADAVVLETEGVERRLANHAVFAMIGREPPLDFFRRSQIPIRGEWRPRTVAAFAGFLLFCIFLYNWKAGGALKAWFVEHGWFPFNARGLFDGLGTGVAAAAGDPRSLIGTLAGSSTDPGFYYALAYTLLVTLFGIRRVRRRHTPYVRWQTLSLAAVQVVPLFLLPYLILPWAGAHCSVPSASTGAPSG